jgi:uncharacterized membrane protein YjgN (DUF898 family)
MDAEGGGGAAPEVARVSYVPTSSLLLLLLKNAGLTLVTLGIYRFWAKTALRRFFWGSIRIGDEPLEYTGRGIELCIGFLIILAVFVGFALVQGLIQFLVLISPFAAGTLQVINIVAFLLLVQAAIFRARRYRLSRTRWRGIRAGQDGSTWRYLGLGVGYGLLTLVTLGLAAPWARVALERYIMINTRFGDRHFSFEATGRRLLPIWLRFYGAVLVVVVLAALLEYANIAYLMQNKDPKDPLLPTIMAQFAGFYLLLILVGGLGSVIYRVAEFRYFTSCTSLGEARFRSAARGWRVALIPVVFFLGIMVVFILAAVPTFLILHTAGPVVEKGAPLPPAFFVSGVVVAVIFFAISYVLSYLWLYVPILKHLCRTFEVRNIAFVESIVQSSVPAPRFGEGLADAFDIGVM